MTDEDVEKIIKANMNLQMNLAGIRQDFEEKTKREWVGLDFDVVENVSNSYTESEGFIHGALWAEAKLKEKNT